METATEATVRPITELDITEIVAIDEKLRGNYCPDEWETRITYYLRRDPEGSFVAEVDGKVVGFMLGEVRSGEFGLTEPTGWIEVLGIDPDCQGKSLGTQMADAMLAHFRSQGAVAVRTLVDHSMPSIQKFFQSLGFEQAAISPLVRRL